MKIVFLILAIVAFQSVFGQAWEYDENNLENNWHITFDIGGNSILGELHPTQNVLTNEMNNQIDLAFSVRVGKMVADGLDLGVEFGRSNLRGKTDDPSNIVWLMQHPTFNNSAKDFQPFSTYYDSDFVHSGFFAKYSFTNFKTFEYGYLPLNLYIKAYIALLLPSAEVGYTDQSNYEFTGLTHPIYLTGRYPNPAKYSHILLSPSIGLNYQYSERVFISIEANSQITNADYIDGIHNFSPEISPEMPSNEVGDYRINTWAIVPKLSLSLTYFFNFDTHRKVREDERPWVLNNYNSHYSKYHKKSKQKEKMDTMPFYNDKSKEEK